MAATCVSLASALLLLFSTSGAVAFDFACRDFRVFLNDRQLERPEPPYCAGSTYAFSDEFEFDRCKSEVEEYRRLIEGYIDCLKSEGGKTIDEFNETVQRFNQRANW